MAFAMADRMANRMAKLMRFAWQNDAPNPNPNPNPTSSLAVSSESINQVQIVTAVEGPLASLGFGATR